MLLFVAPASSDCTFTDRSVSGVSLNADSAGDPVTVEPSLLQVAFCMTVTTTPLPLSRAYPVGGAVSVTVYGFPSPFHGKPSTHAWPVLLLVVAVSLTGFPSRSVPEIENEAPPRSAAAAPV